MFGTVIASLNEGFLVTLALFCVTLVGALPLGLIISFGSMSKFPPLSGFCRILVWIFRGSPLLLQLSIIFYVPGQLGHNIWAFTNGRFWAAAAAFIINYACYFSEIYRGGIQSIPRGQTEAGLVLGMTKSQIFFKVKLAQLVRRIVPPMSNEIITLVKDTSLANTIALAEVIWAGDRFMRSKGLVWPLFFTGVYYLVFNGVLTIFFGWVEKKLSYYRV
ncbi:MAG TPA: amino acid ABC transporter permease [Candidatus Avoscillospira stercorigallinarum]|uniref:Amino acid ABC transporter permease n=1 Tax=Candidatus Avoscillospira stercorigallinarum TaxID=2840708 RepID=A0A9D0Z7K5_9FIRM|nr:amino acid ABC transporter permease [Candidatus Avoscillospira stercorigallinarum]